MGQRHVQTHLSLNHRVMMYDPYSTAAADFCRSLDVELVGSLTQLAERGDIASVDICTPTPSHAELVRESLGLGISVLCEKPLCSSVEEAYQLRSVVPDASIRPILAVGFIYRHSPAARILKYFLQQKYIGQPLSCFISVGGPGSHAAWKHQRGGGGIFLEKMVHLIDLAGWLFGEITSVANCYSTRVVPTRFISGQEIAATADDLLVSRVLAGSVETICMADFLSQSYKFDLRVDGTRGTLSVAAGSPWTLKLEQKRGSTMVDKTWPLPYRNWLKSELRHFSDVLASGTRTDYHNVHDTIGMFQPVIDSSHPGAW
jgi:predicted dehydrogenase